MTKNNTLNKTKVGITIGDMNGIGPEIVAKALYDQRVLQNITPVIYGSASIMEAVKENCSLDGLEFHINKNADDAKAESINVIEITDEELEIKYGQPTDKSAKLAIQSLEAATKDMVSDKLDVLVTAPIDKDAMNNAGFNFPGHTEYLAEMANVEEALMMMVAPGLKVALVTSHIPLRDVPDQLTQEKITKRITQLTNALQKDFGVRKPRIAVLGINPHSGEKGKMGTEEGDIILPVIQAFQSSEAIVMGPYPADGFFGSQNRKNFDAVLAIYHDQGLAPFKALAFDDGVNFTAGLPIVRTSPDHGTAFEIAGKNQASHRSFLASMELAVDIFRKRNLEKEINADPLQKQKLPK